MLDLLPVDARDRGLGDRPDRSPVEPAGARGADVALCWGEIREADPLGVVPSVSSALTLALGDALTVAVMVRRGFAPRTTRCVHPSGSIGRQADAARRATSCAVPRPTRPSATTATFETALATVTKFTLGGVSVVDATGRLVGIVTDGDVRRVIAASTGSVQRRCSQRPVVRRHDEEARRASRPRRSRYDALRTMENHQPRPIYLLPVVDDAGKPVGMIHMHTLVQAGLTSGKDDGVTLARTLFREYDVRGRVPEVFPDATDELSDDGVRLLGRAFGTPRPRARPHGGRRRARPAHVLGAA